MNSFEILSQERLLSSLWPGVVYVDIEEIDDRL